MPYTENKGIESRTVALGEIPICEANEKGIHHDDEGDTAIFVAYDDGGNTGQGQCLIM
ncbi:hypothetical protein FRC04_006101 [Tulasnella sp. 424]|nr:hypothetical protein FRC04_006101 [Tulasnella sp. 424]KAG8964716.1 hypothetical protein FRC05_003615 [Tulasnella sp. 425]